MNNKAIINNSHSIIDLAKILREMHDKGVGNRLGVGAIHIFGIKYGKCIIENNYSITEIIDLAHLKKSYTTELSKGINIYKALADNVFDISLESLLSSQEKHDIKQKGQNILYYGVPGSGKSFTISQICSDDSVMERIVFYPDYSHSDFIGQIVPRLNQDKNLEYVFSPGPFTRILKKAYNNPNNIYYLVIEEINRGNAAAIFGEVFQLLDRDQTGKSAYSINNYDIAEAVYNDSEHPIRIPSNLTLLATMNTSDQNVFTLDTAFQRRWTMKHLPNNFDNEHSDDIIEGTQITWGAFAQTINKLILQNNSGLISSGDKRLGVYFAREDELKPALFSEKVLKYLWDDAFKLDRDTIFNEKYKSIEELIEDYETEVNDKLAAVSNPSVYQKMLDVSHKKD